MVRKIDSASSEEIAALSDLLGNSEKAPLLLFDKIEGYDPGIRIASNCTISPKLCGLALGLDVSKSNVAMMREYMDRAAKLKFTRPVEVNSGPVNENTMEEVDLTKFPAPKWHIHDGGRYFGTSSLVMTRDPDTDYVNVGNYRMMLHNKDTLGVLFASLNRRGRIIAEKYWRKGDNCPVAASFGHDLGIWLASLRSVPPNVSEYDLAGGLAGTGVKVVSGKLTGLPIPATSEFSIEGEIPPPEKEKIMEGPFCEYTGYYTGHGPETVIRVKRVTYRDSPILLAAPIPRPPHSTVGLPYVAASVWDSLERAGIPSIEGVWIHGGSFLCVISLKQRFPGHAVQALQIASGFLAHGPKRFVIAVDDDIDPSNLDDVVWALTTRADPETSINIIKDAWTFSLDPRLPPTKRKAGDITASAALINACKPFEWIKDFPESKTTEPAMAARVRSKWPQFFKNGS